ncbi:MAG: ribonuclease P protein component [Candidatus Aureabacteria bacterium]|nr:ribonuclease P protein component [Candidatus Auribacterota bacterium]
MSKQYAFSRAARLTGHTAFKEVIDSGRKYVGASMVLFIKENPHGLKFGVAAGKKIGAAVTRNRAKRILREIFRMNRALLKEGYGIVAMPRTRIVRNTFTENVLEYLSICSRAGCMKEHSGKAVTSGPHS